MGYGSTGRFLEFQAWMRTAGIEPPGAICELGDQEVPVRGPREIDCIEAFLSGFGAPFDRRKYEGLGGRYFAAETWRDAGFDYACVDLHGENGAFALDLNHWPLPNWPDRQFDIVTNNGTTEHCPNQLAAFAAVHYLTRPGGLMVHIVPTINYMAHAMVCATPLFFHRLLKANGYRVLEAKIVASPGRLMQAFHYDPELDYVDGYKEIAEESVAGITSYVLQRTSDAAFVPPLDLAGDGAGEIARATAERYRLA